jgi:hypothetical protein
MPNSEPNTGQIEGQKPLLKPRGRSYQKVRNREERLGIEMKSYKFRKCCHQINSNIKKDKKEI